MLLLVILLLGAVMVTGIGFVLAAASRDLMSLMAWGIPVTIILALPALNVLFPGLGSAWARIIPSYYLVEPAQQVINGGLGFTDVWPQVVTLLLLDAALFSLGIVALRRKMQ